MQNFLIMQVLQCPKIYLFNHEHFQHQEWMSENLIFLMTKMFITTGDPPGLGWVEGPWVRETRVRRKMLRNCRGSSGFSFFKRFSFFFTRFFGFLFKRFFRFLFLPFQNILFFWENLKGSSLILHPSGLTLFAFAPYTRRTYSALARFFSFFSLR